MDKIRHGHELHTRLEAQISVAWCYFPYFYYSTNSTNRSYDWRRSSQASLINKVNSIMKNVPYATPIRLSYCFSTYYPKIIIFFFHVPQVDYTKIAMFSWCALLPPLHWLNIVPYRRRQLTFNLPDSAKMLRRHNTKKRHIRFILPPLVVHFFRQPAAAKCIMRCRWKGKIKHKER